MAWWTCPLSSTGTPLVSVSFRHITSPPVIFEDTVIVGGGVAKDRALSARAARPDIPGVTTSTRASENGFTRSALVRPRQRPADAWKRSGAANNWQPEQDEIVRADAGTTVCVQGAPGTGKTAVGLHRAAWLLYAYRDKLARSGVLVVGPNRAFLEHVGAVLPSLGEVAVRHTTVEDMVAGEAARSAEADGVRQVRTGVVRARGKDPVEVAVLKGDARMATVLHRAVWAHVAEPRDPLVLPRGSGSGGSPPTRCESRRGAARRGARYAAAREMLAHRLAHAILVLMEEAGDSPDDRVQDAVARSREVRRYVDAVWPALEPRAVLHRLYTDVDLLVASAEGVLDDDEQQLLLWDPPPGRARRAAWSPADVVLLDELADLLRRDAQPRHVVLDEAQDLSPMQLRAVGRRCSTGAATVLGDIAQGTTPWATPSWEVALEHLGHAEAAPRGARPRLPRAGRRDRLRRAAAARDRTGHGRTDVRPRRPRQPRARRASPARGCGRRCWTPVTVGAGRRRGRSA